MEASTPSSAVLHPYDSPSPRPTRTTPHPSTWWEKRLTAWAISHSPENSPHTCSGCCDSAAAASGEARAHSLAVGREPFGLREVHGARRHHG